MKTEMLIVEGYMAQPALESFKRVMLKVSQGEYYLPPIAKQLFPRDKWVAFHRPPVKVRVEIHVLDDEQDNGTFYPNAL